jgi:hypothetical protein
MVDHIVNLYLFGHDSFTSSQQWIKKVTGSLFCPHCHNVYESVRHLDAVVENKKRRTDMDLIAVNCHRVQVFSTRFIDVVGLPVIETTASLGALNDAKGFEHARYRTAIAKRDTVVMRGSKESNIGLCRVCNRLLYWPIGRRYVVRRELPDAPFFLSDGQTFCTQEFFEDRISRAKLCRVAWRKIRISDNPLDDFPPATEDLRDSLKASQKFK